MAMVKMSPGEWADKKWSLKDISKVETAKCRSGSGDLQVKN